MMGELSSYNLAHVKRNQIVIVYTGLKECTWYLL